MKALITHENSQIVMEAFLNEGHNAYSNDLLTCSGKHPDCHLQMDCFEAIKVINPDFLGMHPECTRLTVTANKWYKPEYADRFPNIHVERERAIEHFMQCVEAVEKIGKGYIENPVGIMSTKYRKPDQIIQPWQFGDKTVKRTCLWLFGLPKLKHTNIVEPEFKIYNSKSNKSGKSKYPMLWSGGHTSKERSKSFPGIARAMAEQWGQTT